jgi:hypothetical protein
MSGRWSSTVFRNKDQDKGRSGLGDSHGWARLAKQKHCQSSHCTVRTLEHEDGYAQLQTRTLDTLLGVAQPIARAVGQSGSRSNTADSSLSLQMALYEVLTHAWHPLEVKLT